MAEELGLRERKKREMRHTLATVAVRLFAAHGFDHVTVADIAKAANVSEKTVFNYFDTKEELMLFGREDLLQEMLRVLRERAEGESVLTALRRYTLFVAERVGAFPSERLDAFRKVVQNSPAILARMQQMSHDHERQLAEVIAKDTGASPNDPLPRVVANVLSVLTQLGFGVAGWPDGRKRTNAQVVASIGEVFDLFEQGLGRYGRRPRPSKR